MLARSAESARARPARLALGLGVALLLAAHRGDDAFTRGAAAYEAKDFEAAQSFFERVRAEHGDSAEDAVLVNLALSALASGDVRACESAANRLATRGARLSALADFLHGNAAFVAAELSEAEAELMQADPTALRQAIQHIDRARASWLRALRAHGSGAWPAARRNLARADRKRALLELKQEDAEKSRQTKKARQKKKKKRKDPGETEERAVRAQKAGDFGPEDIAAIFERLAASEEQKREIRREHRASKQSGVVRDW